MTSAADLTGVLVAEKYELLRLIGRGGMGAVYEARNTANLKRCAVKLLLTPELAGDAEVVKRFFREAKATGMIESEHVVAAFDSGIDAAEHVYYVMECLRGEDLEQTLTRLGHLDPVAAIKILLQAATGLASAHALGIVHRDVKPANLFLATLPGGEVKVKILDFGVAKVKMEVFNESTNSLTINGSVLGTPLYMSPEQLRRASAIDESADVWSLGVVLFECLTGQLPWGNCDGIGELVTAILTLRLPLIQDLAPWVRPELAEIAQRALSRDPVERLRNASELRQALLGLVDGDCRLHEREITTTNDEVRRARAPRLSLPDTVMVGPTPHSGTPVAATLVPRPAPRAKTLQLSLGVALVAVVWLFARRPDSPALVHGTAKGLASPTEALPPPRPNQVAAAAEATPREPEPFALEVGPPGAQVTIDGVPAPIQAGRIFIRAAVGSVHSVQVTFGKRTREQQVRITAEGAVPSKLWVLSAGKGTRRASIDASSTPDARADTPVPAPHVTPVGSDLSEKFE